MYVLLVQFAAVEGRFLLLHVYFHLMSPWFIRCQKLSCIAVAVLSVSATVWNSLPEAVTSCHSLPTFKRRLKTVLFARSYPKSFNRFWRFRQSVATLRACHFVL